jgi:hypothetical protein
MVREHLSSPPLLSEPRLHCNGHHADCIIRRSRPRGALQAARGVTDRRLGPATKGRANRSHNPIEACSPAVAASLFHPDSVVTYEHT